MIIISIIIILIVVVISIVLSIILYSRAEMENSNYRAAHEKIGNCKYNDKRLCIDSTGKVVEFKYDTNGNPIGVNTETIKP
jgi:hypothetical protein